MVPVVEEPTGRCRAGRRRRTGRWPPRARVRRPDRDAGASFSHRARRPRDLGRATAAQTGEPSAAVSSMAPTSARPGWSAASSTSSGTAASINLTRRNISNSPLLVDRAPTQVDETVAALSLDVGATKVDAVGGEHDADGKGPLGARRVSGDDLDNLPATLHPDVDVRVDASVVRRVVEGAAGKLRPDDPYVHGEQSAPLACRLEIGAALRLRERQECLAAGQWGTPEMTSARTSGSMSSTRSSRQ